MDKKEIIRLLQETINDMNECWNRSDNHVPYMDWEHEISVVIDILKDKEIHNGN